MYNRDYYPYPILLNGVIEAVVQKLSGTLLIATHDNASCRFAHERGRLTHCTRQGFPIGENFIPNQ
ncbi:MAG: hypothetical protein WBM66_03570 [Thiothrix litoralis]|jgi:hypothetical protein